MALIPEILDCQKEMARWRHDIHKHPELPLKEQRTASKIAELLRSFGVDRVVENYGGQFTVIGVLAEPGDRAIGLVAGMDGQPIQETNDSLDYRSEYSGCMHAIGLDGEVAMLLGTAKYLAKTRKFQGKIVFIFCSEVGHNFGVKALIENGLFQDFPVEEIYALQSYPGLPAGQVSVEAGPCMSAVAELLIKIKGRGGHGAFPNRANNPINAAAALTHSLEQLVSASIDPSHPLLVSVNSIHSGETYVFVPEEAELKGMVRFVTPEMERWLPARINTLVEKLAEAYGVEAVVNYQMVCPVTINSAQQVRFVQEVAKKTLPMEDVHESQPVTMVGKDFAYFLQEKPGALIYIGNGGFGLYHPQYDFNDEVLATGSSLFTRLAETFGSM